MNAPRIWLFALSIATPGLLHAQGEPLSELLTQAVQHRAVALNSAPSQHYLAVQSPEILVHRLLVQAEDGSVQEQRLSYPQSKALQQDSLAPIARVTDAPARLEIQYSRESDATGSWQVQRIDLPASPHTITLKPTGWRVWRSPVSAQPNGPQVLAKAARFALLSDRPLQAAALLSAAMQQQALSWQSRLELAQARQRLGLPTAQALQNIVREAPAEMAFEARLLLAEQALTEAQPGIAAQYLQAPGAAISPALNARYIALQIALNQVDANSLSDQQLTIGAISLAAYNQASAELNADHLALLERLGDLAIKAPAPLSWAVRDQTNLALGYHYLRHAQPELAQVAFSRVRAESQASQAARLGLGWSQISSSNPVAKSDSGTAAIGSGLGQLLRPSSQQADADARRMTPFRTALGVARGHRAEDLERALGPWLDTVGADPLNPAVQEAWLAIPYALIHLGAFEDASEHLHRSQRQLGQLLEHLTQARDSKQLTELLGLLSQAQNKGETWSDYAIGPSWWRQSEPPRYFFLAQLLQSPAIRSQAQSCRQLSLAHRWLLSDPVLENRSAQALQACQTQLSQAIDQRLEQWADHTRKYLGEAKLALARLHDGEHALFTAEWQEQ